MNRKLKLLGAVLAIFGALTAVALAASSPTVSTSSPTSVTSSRAVLHGTVNPNGSRTDYVFQWGLTKAYGSSTRFIFIGAGTTPVAVHMSLHDLHPGTTYHYRLVAGNHVGVTTGGDHSFKTRGSPPAYAATGPSTAISTTGATITGVVNPNGVKTIWYFQYGPTTTYMSRTVSQTLPAGKSPVPVSIALQALQSGAIFHYRLVAVNRGIPEYGADAMFMTFPNPAPRPRLRSRTRPAHARSRPYVFTTSGRIVGPSSIPATYACSQNVRVRFFLGRHRVSSRLAPVQPDCTFSIQTVFKHRPGRQHSGKHLKVWIHFFGNGYLARRTAGAGRVTLG